MRKYSMSISGLNKENLKIAILGPGAIGGFLASLLWRGGFPVECIGREAEARAISENGVTLESSVFENFTSRPAISQNLDHEIDILFITVKSPYLQQSLKRIPRELVKKAVIIPLLNGMGHAEIIRKSLGKRVAVGTIGNIEVATDKYGVIKQLSRQSPHMEFASDGDVNVEELDTIANILKSLGISVSILKSEAEVIWRKLVRLNAIAATTTASQKPVGFVRSDPEWRELLAGCVKEGSAVAKAEGVDISPAEVMRQIDALPQDLTTSLQRDIAKGIPSELEAITGAVLSRAKKYRIPCPTIKKIFEAL